MGKKVILDASGKRLLTGMKARWLLNLKRRPFRKLCKLKDISPREPKIMDKGEYYRLKDIQRLRDDPEVKRLRKQHARLNYTKRLKPGIKPRSTVHRIKLPVLEPYRIKEGRTNVED